MLMTSLKEYKGDEAKEYLSKLQKEGYSRIICDNNITRIDDILNIVNGHTNERIYLTLEPHLRIFNAYKDIDDHELKGKYTFNTSREAFDFAVNALKKLLIENGYERNGNNEWTR